MKPLLPESTVTTSTSVKDRVFSSIADQQVEPRPCYVYWCENTAMWLVWLMTVLLGALATAVLIFTSTYRYYDIYEAMHDNFVTFFLQVLPWVWVVAFAGLMLVAMRGLRATRRGYRLSPWLVGGSSVGMSVLLGFVASAAGFGFVVDRTLGEYAPMYTSQAEREQILWQMPNDGRLLGQQQVAVSATGTVLFTDTHGAVWTVEVQELRAADRELLATSKTVRLLGAPLETEPARFLACGVFPWMLDKKHAMKDLSAERKAYMSQMYAHSHTPVTRLREIEERALTSNADNQSAPDRKRCPEIAAVRRVSEQMR